MICRSLRHGARRLASSSWLVAGSGTIRTSAPSTASPRSVVARSSCAVPCRPSASSVIVARSTIGPSASAERLQSLTRWPASARSAAVAKPPLPAPKTASFTDSPRLWLRLALRPRDVLRLAPPSRHDSGGAQLGDPRGGVFEDTAEHGLGVLAECRRRRRLEPPRAVHLDRRAERRELAVDRMRRLDDHAALAHLGIGEDAIDGADGRAGHALRPEPREPVVGRAPAEGGLDQRDQHVTVRDAIAIGPEAQVALPLRMLDRAAEPRPELLGEDGDDHVTVTRREGLIGNDRGVARAERPRDATIRPEILRNIREERDLAVEQRQVEVGALASPLATEERSGHRTRAEDPAREVAHPQTHAHRRPPPLARDGHRPGHRLERQVECRPVSIRPLLAVRGDRAEAHALA